MFSENLLNEMIESNATFAEDAAIFNLLDGMTIEELEEAKKEAQKVYQERKQNGQPALGANTVLNKVVRLLREKSK